MSSPSAPCTVACIAESAKAAQPDSRPASQPDSLCDLFARRVGAALAQPVRRVDDPALADTVLVVLVNGPGRLLARIDGAAGQGQPLGTARADAPLDDTAIQAFLDELIAASGIR